MHDAASQSTKTKRSCLARESSSTSKPNRSAELSEASRYAHEAVQRASMVEAQVTSDIKAAGARTGANSNVTFVRDGKIVSTLDARLKTMKSLEEKIQRDMQAGLTAKDAADSIKDVLRYTYILEPSCYGRGVAATVQELLALGYRPVRIKNFWKTERGYTGINTVWKTSGGQDFEVQFHTQTTLETKEANRPLYDRQRRIEPGSTEAVAIDRQIDLVWEGARANPPSMAGLPEVERMFARAGALRLQEWNRD